MQASFDRSGDILPLHIYSSFILLESNFNFKVPAPKNLLRSRAIFTWKSKYSVYPTASLTE